MAARVDEFGRTGRALLTSNPVFAQIESCRYFFVIGVFASRRIESTRHRPAPLSNEQMTINSTERQGAEC